MQKFTEMLAIILGEFLGINKNDSHLQKAIHFREFQLKFEN